MNQGWLCSLCSQAPAESFCFCNREETHLCSSCHSNHFSKYPTRYHQNIPLSAFGHHRIPGYFERLQMRTEAVGKAKESLNQGLQAIDNCIEEFQGKIDEVYKSIWEYGNSVVAEIQSTKATLQEEINKSIEEVEATLYEEQPRLQGKFSSRMRNFNEANQFTLFQCSLNVCEDVRSIIKFSWAFEDVSYQMQPSTTSDSTFWTCSCGYMCNQQSSLGCWNCRTNRAVVQIEQVETNTPHPIAQKDAKQTPSTIPDSTFWICFCGYEYNQLDSDTCLNCNYQKPGVQREQLEISAPQPIYQDQEETKREYFTTLESKVWTCSCGYEYNLKTSWTCLKCNAPMPAAMKAELNKCSKCCVKAADEGKKLCSDCEQSRKQLENSRKKCAVCDTELPQDGKPCLICRKPEMSLPVKQNESRLLQLKQSVPESVFSPRHSCSECGTGLEVTQPCSACLKKKGEDNIKSGQKKTKSRSKGGKLGCEQRK